VKQSAEAGEAIRQLADSITEAAQAATQIAASSQQQLVGTDQVAMAMDNIKQASAQNVTGPNRRKSPRTAFTNWDRSSNNWSSNSKCKRRQNL
jgi:methyl-accepting chemotaxis protein